MMIIGEMLEGSSAELKREHEEKQRNKKVMSRKQLTMRREMLKTEELRGRAKRPHCQ